MTNTSNRNSTIGTGGKRSVMNTLIIVAFALFVVLLGLSKIVERYQPGPEQWTPALIAVLSLGCLIGTLMLLAIKFLFFWRNFL